jgi:8-oxo-dGTP pyrophosphatase MutT (NUDIX family)
MPSRFIDATWRLGLRVAFAGLRAYWFVFRPRIRSVHVAVWTGGRVLLVRTSYRSGLGLPAGGVHRGEPPEQAAVRELQEEVGLRVLPEQLRFVTERIVHHEHKEDRIRIYRVDLDPEPALAIDRREVVWAAFLLPEDAPRAELFPWVRDYLEAGAQ